MTLHQKDYLLLVLFTMVIILAKYSGAYTTTSSAGVIDLLTGINTDCRYLNQSNWNKIENIKCIEERQLK